MKKVVLGTVAVACMAAGMSAQADSRPESLKKTQGDTDLSFDESVTTSLSLSYNF